MKGIVNDISRTTGFHKASYHKKGSCLSSGVRPTTNFSWD